MKVFGDYACFSRPEFKVERVSYVVPTPSAARGILDAIFWKPDFRYEIRAIHVLKLGTQVSILRNEIADRQSHKPITVEHARQQPVRHEEGRARNVTKSAQMISGTGKSGSTAK